MSQLARLAKEYKQLQNEPIQNISAGLIDDNLFEWEAVIIGPTETPYEGGVFKLQISIPSNYPYKPPNIIFKTKVYHPNINTAGNICLDILKSQWSPALSISKTLLSICSLLSEPNPNDPLMHDIAVQLKNSPEEFHKTAKNWTAIYATG
jgi:ubiquitin-conjugating enzyme E2 D/E